MRKNFKKVVNCVAALVFLLNSNIYALPVNSETVAARTSVPGLSQLPFMPYFGELLKDERLARELGVVTLADVFNPEKRSKMEEGGLMVYPTSDGKAVYIFNRTGLFIRVTQKGEQVVDRLYTLLNSKGVQDIEGGNERELLEVNNNNIDLINKILKEINPSWSVNPIEQIVAGEDLGRTKAHLFPRYIHDALGSELVRDHAYFDTTIRNIHIPDDNVLEAIADILNKTVPKIVSGEKEPVGIEDVRSVLYLHEQIEQIIFRNNTNFEIPLKRLRQYFADGFTKEEQNANPKAKVKIDDPRVKAMVDEVFSHFCVNYDYSSLLPQTELLREIIVHDFVERCKFGQPVRLIDSAGNRYDLPRGIEVAVVGNISGFLAQQLGMTSDETIDLLVDMLGLNEMDRVFLKGMYGKYSNPETVILKIGKNFFPSAMLSQKEREELLGAIDLRTIESEPKNTDAAKDVRLIRNPAVGGVGKAVVREEYLMDIIGKITGIRPSIVKLGDKSSDLYFEVKVNGRKYLISIMEAKLIDAAKEGSQFGSTVYELLGSSDTKDSVIKLLNDADCLEDRINGVPNPRKYMQYLIDNEVEIGEVRDNSALPTIFVEGQYFTSEQMSPGSHGHIGTMLLVDAADNADKLPKGQTVIHAFYNGDGINNRVSPSMAGWMHLNNIPIVMLTTTATPIDKKGGKIGIQDKATMPRPQIMELRQAVTAGQEDRFYGIGLPGGEGEIDQQYFNTNTVLFNYSILGPFLRIMKDILGKEEFNKILSPDLIRNIKAKDGKRFQILEGALGSLVLNLAAFVKNDSRAIGVIDGYLGETKQQGDIERFKADFLRIINIGKEDRSRFFTPLKTPSDFWFQFHSNRFHWDVNDWELKDRIPHMQLPQFQIPDGEGQYYADVKKLLEALKGVTVWDDGKEEKDVTEDDILKSLKITGSVKLANFDLRGNVVIINNTGDVVDLNEEQWAGLLTRQGAVKQDSGRWLLDNKTIIIGINQPSPIGKTGQGGVYTEIAEVPITQGVIGEAKTLSGSQAKASQINMQSLKDVLLKIAEQDRENAELYLLALLSVFDGIRFVDNIDAETLQKEGTGFMPLTTIKKEGNRRILLIDVDAFKDIGVLQVVLYHALAEGMVSLIPAMDVVSREIAVNFMALRYALENRISLNRNIITQLSPDQQFLDALEGLQAKEYLTDSDIFAVVIEQIRSMPYYKRVYTGLDEEVREEWKSKMQTTLERYKDAIRIFTEIKQAQTETQKKLQDTEKKAGVVRGLINSAVQTLKKIRMISSKWSVSVNFLDTLIEQRKYIKLDIVELKKTENRYIVDWLKGLTQQQRDVFLFYSSSPEEDVNKFFEENQITGRKFNEQERFKENSVITLLDISAVDTDKPMGEGLCLPYIYSIGGIYLAAHVLVAEGNVGNITDNLVKTTLRSTYQVLFGESLNDEDLNKIFHGKWPKPYNLSEGLEALRKAIVQIEVAA